MGQMITRRGWLKGALAAGAALGVAGALHLPSAGQGLRLLSAHEAEVVAAVAATMFPGVHFPLDGVQAGCVAEVDRILGEVLPEVHAAGFRYLLRALEVGAVVSHGARFSSLSAEARREVLDIWGAPGVLPRRIASDALKMVMGMAYFAHPAVLDHMGYRATCRGSIA